MPPADSHVKSVTSITGAELRDRMLEYPGLSYATKLDNTMADETIGLLKDVWVADPNRFETTMTQEVSVPLAVARTIKSSFDTSKRLSNAVLRRIFNDMKNRQALKTYREDPTALRDLKRKTKSDIAAAGPFGPFLEYLTTVAEPKARAEMLALLELYCESGWAFRDSTATGSLTDGQQAIQDLHQAFEKGVALKPADGFRAIKTRLEELSIPLTIKSHIPSGGTPKDTIMCAWDEGGRISFGRTAAGGMLDVCLPDAVDIELIHTACVSLKSRQDDSSNQQAPRHRRAVVNGLIAGTLRDRRTNTPFTREKHSVYHAAVLYSAAGGLQINKALAKALPDPVHRNAVNFLSFLSSGRGLANDNSRCGLADLLASTQRPFAAHGVWNTDAIEPVDRAARFADRLCESIQALATVSTAFWGAQAANGDVIRLLADAMTMVAGCFPADHPIRNRVIAHEGGLDTIVERARAGGRTSEAQALEQAGAYVASRKGYVAFEPADEATIRTTDAASSGPP